MRPLNKNEIENLESLTANSIELALIEPTDNGLQKSIMDATGSIRLYLEKYKIHDYNLQKQGPDNKILIQSFLLDSQNKISVTASLYRPITKTGDPRIWFKRLHNYVNPNDILAIIAHKGILYLINLTTIDIEYYLNNAANNPIRELIFEINRDVNEVANELLFKLKKIASGGRIKADLNADTAVGRTLERLLNIKTNSSKQPDYKGIELKSYRDKKGNRKNLFAQVPNWELSELKSSAEILSMLGYQRGDDFKLYCTVSSMVFNSQGLILNIDQEKRWLVENTLATKTAALVVWRLEHLQQRLLEKHNETFWIAANSEVIDGDEYFTYSKAEHTKKPILSQFDILINQGIITVDHLIKRQPSGKVSEKGPLFKIKPNSLGLLFPPSKIYSLID